MKIELICSPVPLSLEGRETVKSVCGKEVEHAKAVFMRDEMEVGDRVSAPRGTCRDCWEGLRTHGGYIYGVIDAKRGAKGK